MSVIATLPDRLVSSVSVPERGLAVRISPIPVAGRDVFKTRVFEKRISKETREEKKRMNIVVTF
jgi:hypothetical protein